MKLVEQDFPIDLSHFGILPDRSPPLFRGQTSFKIATLPDRSMEAAVEALKSMEATGSLAENPSTPLKVRFNSSDLLRAWKEGPMDINCIAVIDPKELSLKEWKSFLENIHNGTLMSPNFYYKTAPRSGGSQDDYLRSSQENCKELHHRIDRLYYKRKKVFSIETRGMRLKLVPDGPSNIYNACYEISDSNCSSSDGDGSHVYYKVSINGSNSAEVNIAVSRDVAVLLHNTLTHLLVGGSKAQAEDLIKFDAAKRLLRFAAKKWGAVYVYHLGDSICSYSISHNDPWIIHPEPSRFFGI